MQARFLFYFPNIYEVLRPDFVIVDGLVAANHSNFNAVANFPECIEKTEEDVKVLVTGATGEF